MRKLRKCSEALVQPLHGVHRSRRQKRIPDQLIRYVLQHTVTRAFCITEPEFWGVTRGNPQAALARQVGMYLAHVAFELSLTEVGDLFARDRTTVAHACALVEDRRDDRAFDHTLELIESAVRHLKPPALWNVPPPSRVPMTTMPAL